MTLATVPGSKAVAPGSLPLHLLAACGADRPHRGEGHAVRLTGKSEEGYISFAADGTFAQSDGTNVPRGTYVDRGHGVLVGHGPEMDAAFRDRTNGQELILEVRGDGAHVLVPGR